MSEPKMKIPPKRMLTVEYQEKGSDPIFLLEICIKRIESYGCEVTQISFHQNIITVDGIWTCTVKGSKENRI